MLISSNFTPRSLAFQRSHSLAVQGESKAPEGPAESASPSSVPVRIRSLDPQAVAAVEQDLCQGEYVEGEVIVKLRPGQLNLFDDFASEYGGKVIEKFDIPSSIYKTFEGDLLRLKLPNGITTAEAIAAMKEDERVVYAESNDILHFTDDV